MKAGASGSMVVNAKEEICGIYWGGFLMETSSNNDFLPCASIFNSSVKNFIPAEMI
jgi:V8-like Glu-specific endopeptidase